MTQVKLDKTKKGQVSEATQGPRGAYKAWTVVFWVFLTDLSHYLG